MNEGILLASDIDFMIHGIFKVKVFGQEVWITDSHACILIVMAVMVIFAVIANRKLKHATEKPDTFQNIIELIVEKLDGMVDSTMGKWAPRFVNYISTIFILRENTELTRLMNHPKIEKEEKVRLIEDIFKGRIGDELVGLLRMLVQKGHYKETDQVFTYFIDRVKEYKKIGTAYVTSAMELTPQQKQAVEQKLLDTTKYVQFEIHYTTDPALIGGMVIRIRDRVVDGSVRTRLEHLTRDLERIQLKVGECAP